MKVSKGCGCRNCFESVALLGPKATIGVGLCQVIAAMLHLDADLFQKVEIDTGTIIHSSSSIVSVAYLFQGLNNQVGLNFHLANVIDEAVEGMRMQFL
jgi:hypothetical protein